MVQPDDHLLLGPWMLLMLDLISMPRLYRHGWQRSQSVLEPTPAAQTPLGLRHAWQVRNRTWRYRASLSLGLQSHRPGFEAMEGQDQCKRFTLDQCKRFALRSAKDSHAPV